MICRRIPGGPVIDRQRRRLLLSSAVALVGSAGLGALTAPVSAAEQAGQNAPVVPSAPPPIFPPKPAWLGTFSPNSINLSAPASAPAEAVLPPKVHSRAEWSAADPVQPYVPQTPKGVSLHHTGAPWNGRPGPEQYLRNIQAFHTGAEREWEDIAYHYLIDLDGGIWAGRPPTVRGNPSIYYDPTGLVLFCFLGDYDAQAPTDQQLASVSDAVAWIMKKYTIPTSALTGHRDHAPTSCPGANLYSILQDGSFGKRVKDSYSKLV